MMLARSSTLACSVALIALALACAEDPTVERRGGPLPSDGVAGKDTSGSGGTIDNVGGGGGGGESAGDGGAAGGGGADGPIPFCDALWVMRAKCQRCHGEPLKNGAPVPFLTFEDTKAPYGTSGFIYADAMASVVEDDIMPYVTLNDPPTSLMPPVEPLTVDEKATLLGWLKQGAKPEGGTDCP